MKRSNKKTPKKKGKHVVYAKPEKGSATLVREQFDVYLSSPPVKPQRKRTPPVDVIKNVENARALVFAWLDKNQLRQAVTLGLPEIDDRKNVWRVAL
jgi:hypothetical protein